MKEESEKADLKLNIQKTKIMASGPITSWQIDGEKVKTMVNFIFLDSEITMDSDHSHKIKRCLLIRRKATTKPQFSSVTQSATPWTAACQASLSITNCQSLLKFMSIESVMPSNHLILCRPLLLPPSIFPSIRVFSSESVLLIG